MNGLRRFVIVLLPALLFAGVAAAQDAAAGSAVADQLARSSLRMLGSLLAVLVLVAACAWLARRWRDRQTATSDSIEIISGITLGSKERIVLLRVGDEQVLVGVCPAGMRRLHVVRQQALPQTRDDAVPMSVVPASAEAAPSTFSLSLGTAQ